MADVFAYPKPAPPATSTNPRTRSTRAMLRATRGRSRQAGPTATAPRERGDRPTRAPKGIVERAIYYDQLTGVFAISRRYFVIGAFDGALTVLGLILGATGYSDSPSLILAAGVATSVALAVSSTFGAYEAERVEQDIERQELHRAMLRHVGGDKVAAHRYAIRVSSTVHGIAPLVAGLLPLIPFLLVPTILPFQEAVVAASLITLGFLFALGAVLGSLTKRNVLRGGLRLVIVAILTAFCTFLIGGHGVL